MSPRPPAEGLPGHGRSAQAQLSRPVTVGVRSGGHKPFTPLKLRGGAEHLGAGPEGAERHGKIQGVWSGAASGWGRRASPDRARINVLTSPGQSLHSSSRRGRGRGGQLQILCGVRSLPAFLGSW